MKKSTKTKTSAAETPSAPEKSKPVISPRVAAAAAAAVAPAPEVKKPAAAAAKPAAVQSVTKIRAQIDIGFGNELFIRGNAAGLSWDKGTQMNCVNNDLWTFTLVGVTGPVAVKFLVNDLTWSAGEDYVLQPGDDLTTQPTF